MRLHILVIHEAAPDAAYARQLATEHPIEGEWQSVSEASEIHSALKMGSWDLVLFIESASHPGPGTLAMLSLLPDDEKPLPLIVLAQEWSEDRAADLLQRGAWDCLPRSNPARLGPVLSRAWKCSQTNRSWRNVEAALVACESLREVVFNSVAANLAVLDRHGCIIATNEPWDRFSRDNASPNLSSIPSCGVGTNYLDVCQRSRGTSSEGASEVAQGIQRVIDGSLPSFQFEYPCHSSSQKRWFQLTVTPLCSGLAGAVVAHADITRRKLSDQRVAESEKLFRTLFEHYPDGAMVVDTSSKRILFGNEPLQRMFGYSATEVGQLSAFDLFPKAERTCIASHLQKPEKAAHQAVYSMPVQRMDGSIFPADIATTYFEIGGRPCFVSLVRDVTDRLRVQRREELHLHLMQSLAAASRLEAGLKLCLDAAIRSANFDCGGIYLLDTPQPTLHLVVSKGLAATSVESMVTVQGLSPYYQMVVQGVPVYAESSTLPLPDTLARLDKGLRSLAIVPIFHRGQWLGCMNVGSHGACQIPADSRITLESIAASAAQAIVRLHAQEGLRSSEEKYRGIFDESISAIFVFDKDKRFVDVNQSGLDLLGYSREELMQRRMVDVDTDPNAVLPAHESLLVGGRLINYEHQLRRKDGSIVTVLNNSRPLTDACGNIIGMQSTLIDISDKKRAEMKAIVEETRLRLALEGAQMATWEIDLETGKLDYSTHLPSLMGANGDNSSTTLEALVEKIHPDDQDRVLKAMDAALHGRVAVELEYRVLLVDGDWHWLAGRGRPVIDEAGRVTKIVGASQDITDRKRKEDLLAAEATRRRILIEGSQDGIVVLDQSGKVYETNPRFAEMLGYSPEEMKDLHVWDWDSVWTREQILHSILHRQSGAVFETRHRRKDRTEYDVEVSTNAAELGGQTLAFCVCRDITQRKHMESQLRQAQKLEAVGQLAGGIAHDFNNILAAMMLQLGLLEMSENLDPEMRRWVKDLNLEARRAASLTRQLLMFSQRSIMETKPMDLNQVVADLLRMLGRLIGEHINLTFDSQTGSPPTITADPGMLEQILLNLVVNARDAMPHGGQLAITTRIEEISPLDTRNHAERRPGKFVRLSVADTGVGMHRDVLKRIFEPFFTTKEPGKGTGLGLATVHGIVAQHDGWIEVSSTVGKGSTFHVFLPATENPIAPPNTDAPQSEAPQGCNESILLVEDERTVRSSLCRTLSALGYKVHEAANGQQAIEVWNQQRGDFDLVLTDMIMPEGLTGLDVAQRLQAMKPSLEVIISSGYSAGFTPPAGMPMVGVTFLPKPYTPGMLAQTVRACLDRRL